MSNFNDEVCEYSYSSSVTENFDYNNEPNYDPNFVKNSANMIGTIYTDNAYGIVCNGKCFFPFSQTIEERKSCVNKCLTDIYNEQNKKK